MTERLALQPSTKRAAEKFSRDAKKFEKQATKTPATARKALIKIGIYTPNGNLAKKYK